MKNNAPKFWKSINIFSILLLPLGIIYGSISTILSAIKGLKPWMASIPVISVGNLSVGGTGKTPLVQSLSQHFAEKGEMVAILSRGYGSSNPTPHLVTPNDSATTVGDEPKMLFDQLVNHSVQIWVCPDRVAAAKRAIAKGATILILDDGFQHRQIHRDINILVADNTAKFGNNLPIPAGPLREFKSAQKRADLGIIMNGNGTFSLSIPTLWVKLTSQSSDLIKLKRKPVVAFAGLGMPEKFFSSLRKGGVNVVKTISFSDHYKYSKADEYYLQMIASEHKATLVTTAKDAAKLSKEFKQKIEIVNLSLSGSGLAGLFARVDALLDKNKPQKLMIEGPRPGKIAPSSNVVQTT